MGIEGRHKFGIGPWTADAATGRLRRGARRITLRPKVMAVLVYLAERPGTVVGADEILDAVWGEVTVSSDSVYLAVSQLRRALGDDRSDPRYIETIPKRGYRLIAPVGCAGTAGKTGRPKTAMRTARALWAEGLRTARHMIARPAAILAGTATLSVAVIGLLLTLQSGGPGLAADDEPPARTVAVLPMTALSPEPEQHFFATGMSEAILGRLAQIEQLRVASRTASFALTDGDAAAVDIAERLGVALILEGSVRKAENRVRVTVHLIDGRNGYYLFSETFERDWNDAFAIQDEIAAHTAEAVIKELNLAPNGMGEVYACKRGRRALSA